MSADMFCVEAGEHAHGYHACIEPGLTHMRIVFPHMGRRVSAVETGEHG